MQTATNALPGLLALSTRFSVDIVKVVGDNTKHTYKKQPLRHIDVLLEDNDVRACRWTPNSLWENPRKLTL